MCIYATAPRMTQHFAELFEMVSSIQNKIARGAEHIAKCLAMRALVH